MSYQVLQYKTKQEYLDHMNQRNTLCRGQLVDLPEWSEDPDKYWSEYYKYKKNHPGCFINMRTWLLDEDIEDGKRIRQHVRYDNVVFQSANKFLENVQHIKDNLDPDPGIIVSDRFKTIGEAEKVRRVLLQEESDYYYGFYRRGTVAIITMGDKDD